MKTKYFTVAEANKLLPQIEPLMGELLERRARVVQTSKENRRLLNNMHHNVGGEATSAMVQDFIAIEQLVKKITAFGCQVKDANTGLVDFLAEIDGREVFLCWRYGEPRIAFYHELHTGFSGRIPLEE